jgi:hypothetical protein
MTKYIFLFIALWCLSISSFSQDVITPTRGKDIQAKIIDVTKTDIAYKKIDSPNGPTLTIPKSDVLIIRYADGTKDVLFKQITLVEESKETESIHDTVRIEAKNEAPDIITFTSGEDIQAKVIEVNKTYIIYKLFNSLNDTTLTIPKSKVLIISYANGTKDVLYKQNTVENEVIENENVKPPTELKSDITEKVKLSQAELRMKGTKDSKASYTGLRSGAGLTAVTSLVLTPIVGLIPAVACASSTPRERNLNYDHTELKEDPDYNKAYVRQAHRTKAIKVLAGYLIGSAAWFVLIFGGL